MKWKLAGLNIDFKYKDDKYHMNSRFQHYHPSWVKDMILDIQRENWLDDILIIQYKYGTVLNCQKLPYTRKQYFQYIEKILYSYPFLKFLQKKIKINLIPTKRELADYAIILLWVLYKMKSKLKTIVNYKNELNTIKTNTLFSMDLFKKHEYNYYQRKKIGIIGIDLFTKKQFNYDIISIILGFYRVTENQINIENTNFLIKHVMNYYHPVTKLKFFCDIPFYNKTIVNRSSHRVDIFDELMKFGMRYCKICGEYVNHFGPRSYITQRLGQIEETLVHNEFLDCYQCICYQFKNIMSEKLREREDIIDASIEIMHKFYYY